MPPNWVPATKSSTPTWLRHLHWLLALALIPLAISILTPGESREHLIDRLRKAAEEAKSRSPSIAVRENSGRPVSPATENNNDDFEFDLDEVCAKLPNNRLKGALLPRDSHVPWLFAILAIIFYMTFFFLLSSDRSAKPLHIFWAGFFTATVGVFLLMAVQFLAALSTTGLIRARGILGLIVLLFLLIGISYHMALNPNTGVVASFIGFTLGVGLCEELCKAVPMLSANKLGVHYSWRGAFIWGLASGAGFGVAEGIHYSYDMYNGFAGLGTYLVRFISCVALHAVWSGSVGISIQQTTQEQRDNNENPWLAAVHLGRVIAVPMVLHGLYDTLLKKDMAFLAMLTAIASYGWLAFVIYRLRDQDDANERAAYVASFIRSRTGGT